MAKSRACIRLWAWFSEAGAGSIRLVDYNYTADTFLDQLDEAFVPAAWARFGMEPVTFMYDRSTVYPFNLESLVVREYFKKHEEFKFEPWPLKSWDVNPFRTIWHDFQQSLRLQRIQPQDEEDLWEGIKELWENRSKRPGYWKGLIESLRADLAEVRRLEGSGLP